MTLSNNITILFYLSTDSLIFVFIYLIITCLLKLFSDLNFFVHVSFHASMYPCIYVFMHLRIHVSPYISVSIYVSSYLMTNVSIYWSTSLTEDIPVPSIGHQPRPSRANGFPHSPNPPITDPIARVLWCLGVQKHRLDMYSTYIIVQVRIDIYIGDLPHTCTVAVNWWRSIPTYRWGNHCMCMIHVYIIYDLFDQGWEKDVGTEIECQNPCRTRNRLQVSTWKCLLYTNHSSRDHWMTYHSVSYNTHEFVKSNNMFGSKTPGSQKKKRSTNLRQDRVSMIWNMKKCTLKACRSKGRFTTGPGFNHCL